MDKARYFKSGTQTDHGRLVGWSLTSLFSTNMAISETRLIMVSNSKTDGTILLIEMVRAETQ